VIGARPAGPRPATPPGRVAGLALTVAVALAIGCVAPSAVVAQEERAAPDSPAGFEYALPLESAREQAAGPPGEGGEARPRSGDGAPLFGIGVAAPDRGRGDYGGARPAGGPLAGRTAQGAAEIEPPGRTAGRAGPRARVVGAARRAESGGSALGEPVGIALALVALGLAGGLLLRRRPRWGRGADVALAVTVAVGCGLAPAWGGLYSLAAWGTIALGLVAALIALVVAGRPRPPALGSIALGGLCLLGGWATVSTRWAESSGQALLAADRWLLYAALLALLLLVVRDDRAARRLLAAAALATVAFAGYLCVRLALPGSSDLFLGGRLDDPLGYVNGQAGHLLLALWPALAVAELARRPRVAGIALAVAVVLVGLMLLSQSRAVALAGLLSAALVLAAVPGRRRRAWCLLVGALGVAAAAAPLLDVYAATSPGARRPDEGALCAAVLQLCGVAAVAGTVWGTLRRLADGSRPVRGQLRMASGVALALVGVTLAAGVAAAVGDPAERARAGVREFKALDVDAARESSSRFASGGGNRYDYWRIATAQFRDRPLTGVGAGNYDVTYFAERRTTEDVRQPHSLPLQALAELGLVGLLGVLLLIAGPAVAFARRARRAGRDRDERLLAVAAGGAFAAWLAHTSVDWLHLIPALTGVALCAAAALVAGSGAAAPAGARGSAGGGRRAAAAVTACVAVLAAGAVLVAGPLLADRHTAAARELVPTDPAAAGREARAALRLDDESLPAYYALAAAHARRGDYAAARSALLAAAAREPRDFVTWGLLGDLAVRRGALAAARRAYARAARLNPRDRELHRLARDPRSARAGQPRVTTAN